MQQKPARRRTAQARGQATRPAAAKKRAPRRSGKTVAKKPIALTYRPRTPQDDEYMVQLTEEQLGAVHQQAFAEPFPRDQFLRYLRSGAPTYLIEQDGKRIGYYSYLVGPDAKMHISALVIEPTYQSDGVGTQVMKRLEDEARAAGVQVLEVFVQSSNERSLAFTRKLGFTEAFRVDPNTTCFQKLISTAGAASRAQPAQPPGPPFGYGQPAQLPPGSAPYGMPPQYGAPGVAGPGQMRAVPGYGPQPDQFQAPVPPQQQGLQAGVQSGGQRIEW
ncbi:GNAT family N-acetyltransferase [Alicyclobacillus sp. ALC3]|uniref:GNAT family N-acetyltransferase n=1 Tax=Alicyclobacillus sp. ALC3 TaxID=2796143 RepID=UPI0023784219|nr:GNAT family N-acetyltransferase [Alicyclobacillus sp. ALC3]WDL98222.1 GNAT family N-acetyltransferase [Alicyclobacillus sp. ALC3]